MSTVPEPRNRSSGESIATPLRRLESSLQTPRGLASAVSIAGVLACAILLLIQEQILLLSSIIGVLSIAMLCVATGRISMKLVALIALDLGLVFLYTWSLGPSVPFEVHLSPHRISAVVDGQPFYEKISHPGRVSKGVWVGLYAGPANRYIVGSDGEKNLWGSGPASDLSDVRWSVPRPAWKLTLKTDGRAHPVQASTLRTERGRWNTNPRGEIEGTLGSLAWIGKLTTKHFSLSGRLYRPDGYQGIVFGIGSPGIGYVLVVRMDHRDVRFYHWLHSGITTTANHPILFPVQTVPMLQRVFEFLLPGIILALLLCIVSLALFTLLAPFLDPLNRYSGRLLSKVASIRKTLVASLDVAGFALAALGTAAGALLALNDNQTLPTIEDTATYLWQARLFSLGRLWAPIPNALTEHELKNFFALPFTSINIARDQWFGKYPPGWPAVLSLGAFFDKGWMVTPIVGGLGILLIYLIGRQVYGRPVAMIAAALACASPFVLSMSGSLLSQSATWLWCGPFVFLLIFWYRRRPDREAFSLAIPTEYWFCLAGSGLAIGIAFATRQLDAVAMAIPFTVLLLRRPAGSLWIAAGAILPLVSLALYNIAVVNNPFASGYGTVFAWDRLGFGPSVGGPTPYERDYTFARGLWNFAYDLEHLQGGMLGWPLFFAVALVAVPFLAGRAVSWDWLFLAAALCVMGAYMAYWASGVTGGYPRYWFVTVPWLILLTARGFEELYRFPIRLLGLSPSTMWIPAALFPGALFVVLMVFDVRYFLPKNVLNFQNVGGQMVAAVQKAHLHHAIVFQVQNNSEHSAFDLVFGLNSPLLNSDVLWAVDNGRWDANIMRAFPHRSYYRLNGTVLTRLRPPAS